MGVGATHAREIYNLRKLVLHLLCCVLIEACNIVSSLNNVESTSFAVVIVV